MALGARKRHEIAMSPNKHDEYPGPKIFFLIVPGFAKERTELRSGDNCRLWERISAILELLSNHKVRCAEVQCEV